MWNSRGVFRRIPRKPFSSEDRSLSVHSMPTNHWVLQVYLGGRDKERWLSVLSHCKLQLSWGYTQAAKKLQNYLKKAKLNGPENHFFPKSASVCFLLSHLFFSAQPPLLCSPCSVLGHQLRTMQVNSSEGSAKTLWKWKWENHCKQLCIKVAGLRSTL